MKRTHSDEVIKITAAMCVFLLQGSRIKEQVVKLYNAGFSSLQQSLNIQWKHSCGFKFSMNC